MLIGREREQEYLRSAFQAAHIVVHKDPLFERFVHPLAQSYVETMLHLLAKALPR